MLVILLVMNLSQMVNVYHILIVMLLIYIKLKDKNTDKKPTC